MTLFLAVWFEDAHGDDLFFDHTTGTRGTRMWIPPGLDAVKGILIFGNGAGADMRAAVTAPWLRQFADLHDFALIGTSLWGNLSGTEINTWDAHLAALATASDHPELVHAPWAPVGLSNGGQMSYGFNALRPEKTIAFIANKGCCYNNTAPSAASLKTQDILIAGELDTATRNSAIRGLFQTNRPRGALWSWVEQEGVGHASFADEIVLPFMAEAIRLRYPADEVPTATRGVTLRQLNETDGWLADQSTWKSGLTHIASYDDYPGDIRQKLRAGWLLNENVAFLYRAFSTYDSPVQLEFSEPWPPFDQFVEVRVADHTPATLNLTLDLSGLPDWTKIELFNYAQSVLTLTPTAAPETMLTLAAPINHRGVYGFSALVTHADGVTLSTTNPLVFTAVPEPGTWCILLLGGWHVLSFRRRAWC